MSSTVRSPTWSLEKPGWQRPNVSTSLYTVSFLDYALTKCSVRDHLHIFPRGDLGERFMDGCVHHMHLLQPTVGGLMWSSSLCFRPLYRSKHLGGVTKGQNQGRGLDRASLQGQWEQSVGYDNQACRSPKMNPSVLIIHVRKAAVCFIIGPLDHMTLAFCRWMRVGQVKRLSWETWLVGTAEFTSAPHLTCTAMI